MHPGTESLLIYRDGMPLPAAVRQHLETCAECQARIARLRATRDALRQLPATTVTPPAADTLLDAAAARRRRSTWRQTGIGIAAGLMVAATTLLLLDRPPDPATAEQTPLQTQIPGPTSDLSNSELATLMARSQQLESLLRQMPAQRAVQRARDASVQAALQEQLSLIDFGLSQGQQGMPPRQQERLWRGRVALMESLLNLRYAEQRHTAL